MLTWCDIDLWEEKETVLAGVGGGERRERTEGESERDGVWVFVI